MGDLLFKVHGLVLRSLHYLRMLVGSALRFVASGRCNPTKEEVTLLTLEEERIKPSELVQCDVGRASLWILQAVRDATMPGAKKIGFER